MNIRDFAVFFGFILFGIVGISLVNVETLAQKPIIKQCGSDCGCGCQEGKPCSCHKVKPCECQAN